MLDLAHGKLVNLRPESVQHEFVNALSRLDERRIFDVCMDRWDSSIPDSELLVDWIVGMLRDWGTGLELSLYESSITHFLGGEDVVLQKVAVQGSRQGLGDQTMRLATPGMALKLTALESDLVSFETHARRLLAHTKLRAIQWVNIGLKTVRFVTIVQ